ncbi:MAG: hypothetical protein EA376_13760 [Phycisphaeraceae bacterium]|nr:MAG: hypothetical protein EA376_13760 [Phycisphaeraceae bacterium]
MTTNKPENILPWQRPAEPEHPMVVEGGFASGDARFMLRCLYEELLLSGVDRETLAEMTRDPNYQALYAARHAIGDEAATELLNQAAAAVGALRVTLHESTTRSDQATLTISAKTSE